jgi:hypothetical protein
VHICKALDTDYLLQALIALWLIVDKVKIQNINSANKTGSETNHKHKQKKKGKAATTVL